MSGNEQLDPRYRRGAGVVLFNAQAKVWVGQRIDNPGPAWQMPQGGLDPSEDPETAALRELEEETGIGSHLTTPLGGGDGWLSYDFPEELRKQLWRGSYIGQQQKWYGLQFLGSDSDVNIETKHPEFSAWQWVELEETLDLIVPFKQALYQQIIELFLPVRDQLRASL
ncbi:MAG: RNA pyrophosphohydrolase [Alphaproteobacteria bacterium]